MLGGPVLLVELLLGSRRTRLFIFRFIYGGWLLAQFGLLYLIYRVDAWRNPDATSTFATDYVELFVGQQLVLLALATPALAAGAVTDEKERGTLQYLLTSELTGAEIVIGKLFGRLVGVASIFLAGLPFLLFVGSFTGMGGLGILMVLGQTLVTLFALGAASMLASVWSKQTRDAVLALYATGVLLFALQQIIQASSAALPARPTGFGELGLQLLAGVLAPFSPKYVLDPALAGEDPGELWRRFGWHAFAWSAAGIGCLSVAVARLRGAYIRQLEGAGKKKRQLIWSARPSVGSEPLRWKERFVVGLAPLPIFRFVPRWLGLTLVALLSTLVCLILTSDAAGLGPTQFLEGLFRGQYSSFTFQPVLAARYYFWLGIAVVLTASASVAVRCSGAIVGEKEKQTWEAICLTPLPTTQLVRGKLWGVVGSTYPYLIAYAVPSFVFRLMTNPTLVVLLAIELAVTWIFMFFAGSSGLWCSAKNKSSWRALLGTLAWAYLGGICIAALLSPLLLAVYFFVQLVVNAIEQVYRISIPMFTFTAFSLGAAIFLAVGFLLGSWFFLKQAEKTVADYDRTRHWHDEPRRPIRRRIYNAIPVRD